VTWKQRLLQGTFRGVAFYIESSGGEIGRRVAVHEYPLRDKPYAEDLGRKARRFTLEMFVLGPDYMDARDALIGAIETAGPGPLVHPYLGEMTVTAVEARGPQESTREGGMARFSVTFVESGEATFPASSTDTAAVALEAADEAQASALEEFAEDFDVTGPEFIAAQAAELLQTAAERIDAIREGLPAIPEAATALASRIRTFTGSVEALVREPLALAGEIYGLVSGVLSSIGRVERAFAAYRMVGSILDNQPSVFGTTPSRSQQAANQAAVADLIERAAVIEACRLSAGMVLRGTGATSAAAVSTNWAYASREAVTALRNELADRLDRLMETADDAIYETLADLRAAVVTDLTVRGADLARTARYTPPLTRPALAVAYHLYGHASRDLEIVARNNVRHPGFVPGGIELEVLTDA